MNKVELLASTAAAEAMKESAIKTDLLADREQDFEFNDSGDLVHIPTKLPLSQWLERQRLARPHWFGAQDTTLADALAGNLTAAGKLRTRLGSVEFEKLDAAQGLIPGKPAQKKARSINPWHPSNYDYAKKSFNMTDISCLVRDLGEVKAAAIAASVGCSLTSRVPNPHYFG